MTEDESSRHAAVRARRQADLYARTQRLLRRALVLMDDAGDPLVAAQIALPLETIARRNASGGGTGEGG